MIELMAHVAGKDRKLSEVWLFQWERDPADLLAAEVKEPVQPKD
ncbi:MAG: hypothetical protein ABJM43_11610 [Paracoccaceae bacterium]